MGAEVAAAVEESLNTDDVLRARDQGGQVQPFRIEAGWTYEIVGRPRETESRVVEIKWGRADKPDTYEIQEGRQRGKEVGVEVRIRGDTYRMMTAMRHWSTEEMGRRAAEFLGWAAGEWEIEAEDELGRRQPCEVHAHWKYTIGRRKVRIQCKYGDRIRELRMDPDIPGDQMEEELTKAMGATKRKRRLSSWNAEGQPQATAEFREGWGYEMEDIEYLTDSTPETSAAGSQSSTDTTRVWFRDEVIEMRDDVQWADEERHRQYRADLGLTEDEPTRLERRDVCAQSDREPEWALIEADTVRAAVHFGVHTQWMELRREWTEEQVIEAMSQAWGLEKARPKELNVSIDGYAAEFGISGDRQYWLKYRTTTVAAPQMTTKTAAELRAEAAKKREEAAKRRAEQQESDVEQAAKLRQAAKQEGGRVKSLPARKAEELTKYAEECERRVRGREFITDSTPTISEEETPQATEQEEQRGERRSEFLEDSTPNLSQTVDGTAEQQPHAEENAPEARVTLRYGEREETGPVEKAISEEEMKKRMWQYLSGEEGKAWRIRVENGAHEEQSQFAITEGWRYTLEEMVRVELRRQGGQKNRELPKSTSEEEMKRQIAASYGEEVQEGQSVEVRDSRGSAQMRYAVENGGATNCGTRKGYSGSGRRR
jgi:hypothetical protein